MRITIFYLYGYFVNYFKLTEGFATDIALLPDDKIVVLQNITISREERKRRFSIYDRKGTFIKKAIHATLISSFNYKLSINTIYCLVFRYNQSTNIPLK